MSYYSKQKEFSIIHVVYPQAVTGLNSGSHKITTSDLQDGGGCFRRPHLLRPPRPFPQPYPFQCSIVQMPRPLLRFATLFFMIFLTSAVDHSFFRIACNCMEMIRFD